MHVLRDVSLVVSVGGLALLGSQVPRFVQEYEQRLGGALEEAERELAAFRSVATTEGLTFPAYVARLQHSGDSAVARTGGVILALDERTGELRDQARLLEGSGTLVKPFVLVGSYDPDVAAATWRKFNLTFTLDPLFAGLAALAGWLLHAACWSAAGRARQRRGRTA